MRAAVIGAGPSGFFVAGEILKKCPGCEVHMFEKRVAPYGLVRFGVAPDHPLTRRVTKMFDQTADHARFHYHGNVDVGRDIPLPELHGSFHAVILCTGAERPNRPDIPGGRLTGAVDALDIARWVNGEPEAFDKRLLDGVDTAVIVGNGNVALDVARMLARPSADWVGTDIAPHAMEALIHHRIRRIVIAGRRGPVQASFTEAELEELGTLTGWQVRTLPADLQLDENERHRLEADPDHPAHLRLRILHGWTPDLASAGDRVIEFIFHRSTDCLLGSNRVSGIRFSDPRNRSGGGKEIQAQLVVFATGHRGIPLTGLPFDDASGTIPNTRGRVIGGPGWYVCGWIKRGAKGLIGQNRKDAIETVASMLEDRDMLAVRQVEPKDWPDELAARGVRALSWPEWKRIDALEMQRGSAVGRSRINLTRDEALRAVDPRDPS